MNRPNDERQTVVVGDTEIPSGLSDQEDLNAMTAAGEAMLYDDRFAADKWCWGDRDLTQVEMIALGYAAQFGTAAVMTRFFEELDLWMERIENEQGDDDSDHDAGFWGTARETEEPFRTGPAGGPQRRFGYEQGGDGG